MRALRDNVQGFCIFFLHEETKNDWDFSEDTNFEKQLQGQKYSALSKFAVLEIYVMQLDGDHL